MFNRLPSPMFFWMFSGVWLPFRRLCVLQRECDGWLATCAVLPEPSAPPGPWPAAEVTSFPSAWLRCPPMPPAAQPLPAAWRVNAVVEAREGPHGRGLFAGSDIDAFRQPAG